jgi:hypothetical protein
MTSWIFGQITSGGVCSSRTSTCGHNRAQGIPMDPMTSALWTFSTLLLSFIQLASPHFTLLKHFDYYRYIHPPLSKPHEPFHPPFSIVLSLVVDCDSPLLKSNYSFSRPWRRRRGSAARWYPSIRMWLCDVPAFAFAAATAIC